jgi:hypothetical protein
MIKRLARLNSFSGHINRPIQFFTILYLFINIGFWPIALMYKDSYDIRALRVEEVLYSLLIGVFLNLPLLLLCTKFRYKLKRIVFFSTPLALISCFVFLLPSKTPFISIPDDLWISFRVLLSLLSIIFIFTSLFKNFGKKIES